MIGPGHWLLISRILIVYCSWHKGGKYLLAGNKSIDRGLVKRRRVLEHGATFAHFHFCPLLHAQGATLQQAATSAAQVAIIQVASFTAPVTSTSLAAYVKVLLVLLLLPLLHAHYPKLSLPACPLSAFDQAAPFPSTLSHNQFLSKMLWNMLFAQFLLLFLVAYLWTIDGSCCFVSSVWLLVSTFVVCFGDKNKEWATLSAHKSQKVINVPEVISKKRKYILNFFLW